MRAVFLLMPMLTAATAGCATPDAPIDAAPIPIEREAITYATSPCYGTCPVYSVTVTPKGEGVFEGRQHVAATGTQRFAIDPADYRRLAAHLASVRPESGNREIAMGSPECGVAPTDMPGITVRWASNTGAADQSLDLYLGCRSAEATRVAAVLRAVPDMLPIGAYVGKR